MSSLRYGSRTAGRSGDDNPPRRPGAYMDSSQVNFPPKASRKPRKEVDTAQPAVPAPGRPTIGSRIPQTSSTRVPPVPAPSMRPALPPPAKSYGFPAASGSTSSARLGPKVPALSIHAPAKSKILKPEEARAVLRRKSSNLSQETSSARNNSHSGSHRTSSTSSVPRSHSSQESSGGLHLDRGVTASPTELQVAHQVEATNAHNKIIIYPELDRYRDVQPPLTLLSNSNQDVLYPLATHDLPPPTPLFSGTSSLVSGVSGSPSTRFSESPGPGPYSRDTTPTTSISSQSPGLVAPMRIPPPRARPGPRGRAGSFTHEAPNERSGISAEAKTHTLAAIRESLTSSSSSSNGTVRDGDKKGKKKKKRLSPLPPSPPPRKSSQKFKKTRDEESSPSKPPREPAQPVMTVASPAKATTSIQSPSVSSPRVTAPVRPSRDGTPDLQTQMGLPMPIIHSNLSSSSLAERRASIGLGPSAFNRSITPSSQPDRYQAPSRLPVGREPTPAPRPEARQPTNTEPGKTALTPSPSVSTFRTRFPLFGRRKTAPEVPQVDKKEKPARKGPAAGTGHEGYGRLGAHRRKSSTASSISRGIPGTMSSQESMNSPQFHDPFLAERMNPVVIAGGEVIENRNSSSELSRVDSNLSIPYGRPSVESRNNSQVSLSSREGRTTLWPSAFPRPSSQTPSLGKRRPSDASESDAPVMKPTLAFRRSIQRLQSPDQAQFRLPKPIVVRPPQGVTSPSLNSLDTSVMSDDSVFDSRQEPQRGRKGSAAAIPKKLTKRARSPRKWNIFGRSSQSQPATTKKKADPPAPVPTAVKVMQVRQETKPVAFYTMMDFSEQEDGDTPDVQEVLREAHVYDTPPPASRERRPSTSRSEAPREPATASQQAAPPPRQEPVVSQGQARRFPLSVTPEPAFMIQNAKVESPASRIGRPSRLQHVGRIPPVVSARAQPASASPMSFSRPFNRISRQMQSPVPGLQENMPVAKDPSPPQPATPEPEPEPTLEGSTLSGGTLDGTSWYRMSKEYTPPDHGRVADEFLSFSPRKGDSQSTSCTTSTSSGILSFAGATAVVPEPYAPLVEDEIWDEYNDLLGEEQLKVPPSAGSSQGVPFHLEGYGKRLGKRPEAPLESPTINHNKTPSVGEMVKAGREVPSSVYSADLTARINEALEAARNTLAPFSVTSFVTGSGDYGSGSRNASRNASVDLGKQLQRPQRNSSSSNGSGARRPRRSDASECSQTSEDNSPLSQVNLRVGSMTVSKWLTFGQVLFSPARDELVPVVGSLKRHSILVVDGLGNDDWSFYAAETYPAATFYNLSPRAPLPAAQPTSSAFPLSPPNHHQIQYTNHLDKFPFGPESFTTVVFRFPAAAPNPHYHNIIAEARRVLKPGGYLELSILDLDLNNMGNRGRRAVRRLKERIRARDPETHIGSTADLMLRLVGGQGFTDIKSCRVGVPVASTIPQSSGGSTASSSSGAQQRGKRDNRSLAEMMQDESAVADESITKMVARVGRWWYSRCYEAGSSSAIAVGGGSGGLWSDKALLAECEEWRTSLKLMVCYARMPDVRRVASI